MQGKLFLFIFIVFFSFIRKNYCQPDIPVLDSVSVDLISQHVLIGWQPSADPNTKGYIIYESAGGGVGIPIDTVWGITSTTYTDLKLDPKSSARPYRIAALDNNNLTSPMGLIHSTIFLSKPLPNPCDSSISLSWTSYSNFNPSISGYDIFVSINNSAYHLLGSVGSSTTNFIHQNVTNNFNYCYFIRANAGNKIKTSSSNISCIRYHSPSKPKFIYIRTATVEGNKFIRLKIYSDSSSYISKINILKSDDKSKKFNLISTLFPSGVSDLTFLDDSTNVKDNNYFYQVIAYDSCGKISVVSNIVKTMKILTSSADESLTNKLSWNDYEGFDAQTGYYDIYRKVDENNFELAAHLSVSQKYYSDDISAFLSSQGYFTYYIEAIESNVNKFGFSDTSRSNEITVKQNPFVWIPNAFTPGGLNPYFYPVCSLIDENNYQFLIYNRWGEKIFETNQPHNGWDGNVKGTYAPEGIYSYVVTFKDTAGKITIKKGLVTLIR